MKLPIFQTPKEEPKVCLFCKNSYVDEVLGYDSVYCSIIDNINDKEYEKELEGKIKKYEPITEPLAWYNCCDRFKMS